MVKTTPEGNMAESTLVNGTGPNSTGTDKKDDCHNIVKSSGVGRKKHLCCEHHRHQKGWSKPTQVNVSCQTDIDSEIAAFAALMNGGQTSVAGSSTTSTQGSPSKEPVDGSQSEGLLRLLIHNFRNMNNTVRGPPKVVSGVPWKIMVMPRQHVVAKKGTQKCLGFFLQCCPESYSDSWSCQAAAELRLISQKPGIPNFVRKTNHVYTAKENDWGYSCFMTWADILDENQGYMRDEKVILEVYVKADLPKGILTYDAFCKKIQDYMRLADLQSSRGLIDKALEVNQSAVKFCKDKDTTMKGELDKQKSKLIEMKLKQSIERIEKGTFKVTSEQTGGQVEVARKEIDLKVAAARYARRSSNQAGTNNNAKSHQNATGNPTQVPTEGNKKDSSAAVTPTRKSSEPERNEIPPEGRENPDGESPTANETDPDGAGGGGSESAPPGDETDENDSGDEDDSEEPYVCDSCLEERLDQSISSENLQNAGEAEKRSADSSESCCQTEFGTDADKTLAWLMSAATLKMRPNNADSTDKGSTPKQLGTLTSDLLARTAGKVPTTRVVTGTDATVTTAIVHVQPPAGQNANFATSVANEQKKGTAAAGATPPSSDPSTPEEIQVVRREIKGIGEQITATAVKKFNLSEENEHRLLKMITEESKHSLNSIRDTLERLVCLADPNTNPSAGATGPQNDLSLNNNNLGPLVKFPNSPAVKTDIIELPPILSEEDGDKIPSEKPPTGQNQKSTVAAPVGFEFDASKIFGNGQPQFPPPPQDPKQPDPTKLPANPPFTPGLYGIGRGKKRVASPAALQLPPQMGIRTVPLENKTTGPLNDVSSLTEVDKSNLLQQFQDQDSKLLSMMIASANANISLMGGRPVPGLNDNKSKQQFVQTEVSYSPRAPSPVYTDEQLRLLAQANDLPPDAKPEELISRYSHLIEQSEANRLAETVKKVEKRMKDIEKQTMTCRKELADECERHYKEEQKLIKNTKQLKQQIDQSNEKLEKLNNQLKEKRQEVKKLEKRLKFESQAAAENADLLTKVETMERELQGNSKKNADEIKRLQKENQKLIDARDSLQQELSYATSEIDRLTLQVEEKTAQIKKLEAAAKTERNQTQSTLKEANERAKKAEINLLEFKSEMSVSSCQKAVKECESRIAETDEVFRRFAKANCPQESSAKQQWAKYLEELQRYKEKITKLMEKTKVDFASQMDSIRCGRSLASLPVLEVPTVPSLPSTAKLPMPQQLNADSKKIAPIGVNPSKHQQTSPGGTNANGPQLQQQQQQPHPGSNPNPAESNNWQQSNMANGYGGGMPPGMRQPMNGGPNASLMLDVSVPPPPLPQIINGPNLQNFMPQGSHMSNQSGPSQADLQLLFNAGGGNGYGPNGGPTGINMGGGGFSPWSDNLSQQITATLFGNKSLGSLNDPAAASGSGWNSWGTVGAGSLGGAGSFDPSGGGMAPIGSGWNPAAPPMPMAPTGRTFVTASPSIATTVISSAASPVPPVSLPIAPNFDSRTNSPAVVDIQKKNEMVLEQLRSGFPNLSPENILEHMTDYMCTVKAAKTQPIDQLVQGVTQLILNKRKLGDPSNPGWRNSVEAQQQSADQLCCGICRDQLQKQKNHSLACKHRFHVKCLKEYFVGVSRRECPICRTVCPTSEEFPDLA